MNPTLTQSGALRAMLDRQPITIPMNTAAAHRYALIIAVTFSMLCGFILGLLTDNDRTAGGIVALTIAFLISDLMAVVALIAALRSRPRRVLDLRTGITTDALGDLRATGSNAE